MFILVIRRYPPVIILVNVHGHAEEYLYASFLLIMSMRYVFTI